MQVVPSQGVHAYVVTAHTTGHNKGRVMRLNTVIGAVDPRAFSTSKPRPLAVSDMRTMALLHAYVTMHIPMPKLHVSLATGTSRLQRKLTVLPVKSDVFAMQVSQSGGYVSTVDKHTVHVWSTRHSEWPSLKLHSTKALTVGPLSLP